MPVLHKPHFNAWLGYVSAALIAAPKSRYTVVRTVIYRLRLYIKDVLYYVDCSSKAQIHCSKI